MSPVITSYEEQYLSPLATAELVGRKGELKQVEEAILDRPQRQIVYIKGQGGIGKTRLVHHILDQPPGGIPLLVASRPVDMYHTFNHTVEGLIQAFQDVLDTNGQRFRRYSEERRRLYEIAREERVQWQKQREQMLEAFIADWNDSAHNRRILVALDTVERLFLQEDPVAQRLSVPTARSLVYDWLLHEFFPRIENTVVILAGRPVRVPVERELEKAGVFHSISLSGLTEEETLEYFDKLIPTLRASGRERDIFAAERLIQWDEEFRRMVFHTLRDDETIRPILLALAIDHLAISGESFSAARSVKEAKGLSLGDRARNQRELLQKVEGVIRDALHPAAVIIEVMGWLRKGADVELLTRITGQKSQDVKQAYEWARELSFIKTRPADQRLFLHDEMYALLQDPREAIPQGVFDSLKAYYREKIDQTRSEIADIHRQAEPGLPDFGEISDAMARLRDALADDLHYTLRRNALRGFDEYFLRAEEALSVGDEMLDIQLRAELLDFWRERDPKDEAEKIDGLRRSDSLADAAIRWIKRLIAAGRYDDALAVAQQLRGDKKGLVEDGGPTALVELDVVEALLCIYKGELQRAEELLRQAEEDQKAMAVPPSEVRWKILMGQLYNAWGYLRRVQGQFITAADMYWKALPYWRGLNMEAEQANTLTNLAFARALCGDFTTARIHAQDALGLRRRQGLPARVSLTLNTLAEIEIYAGQYREAEQYAQEALEIARQTQFRRGEGLAHLSLAACYRFMSEPPCPAHERKELLEKSLEHSRKARETFYAEPKEPERMILAWYAAGVTHREFCRQPIPDGINAQEHAREAKQGLQQAMDLAKEEKGFRVLYLDAALGLAWMYYYTSQVEELERHLQKIEKEIKLWFPSYLIAESSFPQVHNDTILGVFAQLARMHILKGVRAMDAFEHSKKQPPYDDLTQAVQEFALALEYDSLIAEDFRDKRRAIRLIHDRLKGLNVHELMTVYNAMTAMAQDFGREKKWAFWQQLEALFGPYEVLSKSLAV